ncbi:MAG: C25 family cysteine peptidase [Planctomycetota bacterium]|nr:C25 family cysteine peptidase [Planctomycetota bacterium]
MKFGAAAARLALGAGAVVCLISTTYAQIAGPQWVALDTLPAGTPPSVVVDRGLSSEDQSVLNITIHGFYVTPVNLPGLGNFSRISLDINGISSSTMEPGKPEIPVFPLLLAIPTNAPQLSTPQVTVLQTSSFPNVTIYPAQADYIEEEGVPPTPPTPVQDAAFYNQNTTYPAAAGQLIGGPDDLLGVRAQQAQVNPFRYNPATRTLTVNRSIRVFVGHNGAPLPATEVTRRTNVGLASIFDNYTVVLNTYVFPNLTAYEGEYLIIAPADWVDTLNPFITQKRNRGYRVTVRTSESIGTTPAQFLAYIDQWQNSRPAGSDDYVLLVGDTDRIPLGYSPRHAANVSDYAYSCNGVTTTSSPDRYLGRISVANETELSTILTRSINYQNNPANTTRYDNILLAGHNQVSNGYVDCINQIAAAVYPGNSPDFTLRRGTQSNGTVANVKSDIAAGQGIVLYRGHGGGTNWSDWDFNHDSLTKTDVNSMAMNIFVRPIIFSVACTNSQIDRAGETSISEAWHRRSAGAVAHVGGTRATWTVANHTYAKANISWINTFSFTPTMGMTVNLAGATMAFNNGDCGWDNRFLYLLQGDPELMPWRENPSTTTFGFALRGGPAYLAPGARSLQLTFTNSGGDPIANAIVSAYKENDVQVNGYTDATGNITLDLDIDTCGQLRVTAYTDTTPNRPAEIVLPIAIRGDANRDGVVDFTDVVTVLQNWGASYEDVLGQGDADFSLIVNFSDVIDVLRAFGNSCQ